MAKTAAATDQATPATTTTTNSEELGAAFELLRDRIAAARAVQPQPKERHCLDCFQRGRDAAIRAILGDN